MDFELVPNTALTQEINAINQALEAVTPAEGQTVETNKAMRSGEQKDGDEGSQASSQIKDVEQLREMEQEILSQFTFSNKGEEQPVEEEEEDLVQRYLDLAVPQTYKIKFNFTPEK